MTRYTYLIIGGGMTADAAVRGIRSADATGSIGIIAGEPHEPYKRPPLSKGLWKGEASESIWLDTGNNASVQTSRTVTRLLPKEHTAIDDRGVEYAYDKLLLATGGRVRTLPGNPAGVLYFRTFDDFELLRKRAVKGSSAVVIGGGFIGWEIAAALAMNGVKVVMIFPQDGIGAKIYPHGLSMFLNTYYASQGIAVFPNERVENIQKTGERFMVETSRKKPIEADTVVAGLGIEPDTTLASPAGLQVRDGILVNEYLETSIPGIFAAGDVANFMSPALGTRTRFEHEDNAIAMGTCAGRNMAGVQEKYTHLPFFYSDLFEMGYEAVGEIDSHLDMQEEWKDKYGEGIVFYLKEKRVRGVLLWNTWGQVDNARRLITERTMFRPGLLAQV
jgi:3-phenylpropionate/trans-cinnamate dioxygenase ferredoxin reductase subunit